MNDLLHVVKGGEQHGLHHQQQHGDTRAAADVEAGWGGAASAPGYGDGGADMQAFFARAKEVQASMDVVRGKQRDLWRMHEHSKTIVRRQEITEQRERMQVRAAAVSRCACVAAGAVALRCVAKYCSRRALTVAATGSTPAAARKRSALADMHCSMRSQFHSHCRNARAGDGQRGQHAGAPHKERHCSAGRHERGGAQPARPGRGLGVGAHAHVGYGRCVRGRRWRWQLAAATGRTAAAGRGGSWRAGASSKRHQRLRQGHSSLYAPSLTPSHT